MNLQAQPGSSGASQYRILREADLRDYLAGVPAIVTQLGGAPADWSISEVGDGNLNLVFIVKGGTGGIAVKQALPYVRLVGESWPLPLSRAHYEHMALVHQARLASELVPAVLHHDAELALTAMELLEPHIIMRKGLIEATRYPRFVDDISTFLAQTLFFSSDLALSAAAKKQGIADFAGNHALCKITEDLIFTDPYRIAEQNRWTAPYLDATAAAFREDLDLHVAISRLKLKFMASPEALLHGDLHTGSIMVTESETKVIDPEFAFYGPMGFDIGAVIGNLLMAYLASAGHERTPGERAPFEAWLLETIEGVWTGFPKDFSRCGAARLMATAIRHRCLRARRAPCGWRPSGRPTWRGCSGTRSGSPRPRPFGASSAWRTTSISSGSRTRSSARSARHGPSSSHAA